MMSNPSPREFARRRLRIIVPLTWLTVVLAVASLVFAWRLRASGHAESGHLLVGAWTLIPPVWFLVEWCLFSRHLDDREREHVKHLQDLARNIWLALIAVLAAILGLVGPN